MKKILITISCSLLVGAIFALIIFKNVDKEVAMVLKEEQTLNFFQVGVFKNEANANNFMQNYNSSIVIKDKDYYRVIIAILISKEALEKEKAYFDSLGIEYYIKQENVNNDKFVSKLKEYESLLISSSDETYNTINKNILKLYEGQK